MTDMQTGSAQLENDFGGHFDSQGGPQFLASNLNTNGAPINFNFDSSTGIYMLQRILCAEKVADEMQTIGFQRAFANYLISSSPRISPVAAMSCNSSNACSAYPPATYPNAASFMACRESGRPSWL